MNRNVKGLKPSLLTFHLYQFLFHHAVPWISFSVAILTLLRVWKKMLPAVSVNKGCCSRQPITFQPRWQWALRELTVETGCPPSSHQPLQPPLTVRPEDAEDGKTPDPGPNRRTEISEPRLLHLPKHRKALKSLTGNVCVVWCAGISWCLTIGFCCFPCKHSYTSWLLLTSLEQFLWV